MAPTPPGFGRRKARQERQAVEPADHENEQQHRRPDVLQAAEALAPGGLGSGRQEVRAEPADQRDGDHVHCHREDAGNDAGDEQLSDVLLGDDAVDRKHGRRRQHGAQRAAGRDHAGGEGLRIAEAAHFRIGDRREGRSCRHRRAADRGKAAAGRDGGNAEPAAQMADKAVGGAEQFAAHAGIADERSHQQEHRDHAEGVVGDRAHRGLADQFQRRREADQIPEAADADEAHRHADGHAQQHQRKQRDKSEDGDGVGTHATYSTVFTLASWISSGWKISR